MSLQSKKPAAKLAAADEYLPPPGPPPGKAAVADYDYTAPPPGPPPSYQAEWAAAVPDTALFPPPPALFDGYDRSPATNASESDAQAGESWCRQHGLYAPAPPLDPTMAAHRAAHRIRLVPPPSMNQESSPVAWDAVRGSWQVQTSRGAGDALFLGYPASYAVAADSPLLAGRKTAVIYYEVVMGTELDAAHGADGESSLAIGFAALPYPTFRQPGWHRGSVAVHGDDGHRFVNDMWGGKHLTAPFRRGHVVGLGMQFALSGGRVEASVFFTRNGKREACWDVNEETDTDTDRSVEGLQGYHDLSAAVGTFGHVSFEVVFDPAKWRFQPEAM